MSKKFVNPVDFIIPLNINGMDGRLLRIESPNRNNKREILFIYDLESNLEKWWGLAVALKSYANVTMVDLPGLGGMDSFYSIGRKPTLDNMADYLAALVKLRYKRKRLTIMGVGFGFVIVTRMLQRNPEISTRVNMVLCINGYAHKDDFKFKPSNRRLLWGYSQLASIKPVADLLSLTTLNTPALRLKYPLSKIKSRRGEPSAEFIRQFKIDLDKSTDLRTKMYLNRELLKLDNCQMRVNKTLWHITTSNSARNVDLKLIEQHFKVIFDKYYQLPAKVGMRSPPVLNDDRLAIKYLPAKVRRELKTHS